MIKNIVYDNWNINYIFVTAFVSSERVCFCCSDVITTEIIVSLFCLTLFAPPIDRGLLPAMSPLKETFYRYILSSDCHHTSTWYLLYNHTYSFNNLVHIFLKISSYLLLKKSSVVAYREPEPYSEGSIFHYYGIHYWEHKQHHLTFFCMGW